MVRGAGVTAAGQRRWEAGRQQGKEAGLGRDGGIKKEKASEEQRAAVEKAA
jgi:hypothetical protein